MRSKHIRVVIGIARALHDLSSVSDPYRPKPSNPHQLHSISPLWKIEYCPPVGCARFRAQRRRGFWGYIYDSGFGDHSDNEYSLWHRMGWTFQLHSGSLCRQNQKCMHSNGRSFIFFFHIFTVIRMFVLFFFYLFTFSVCVFVLFANGDVRILN